MMALKAQAVIVGWQVYSLTHDLFMLGLTGLAEAIPALACALFAGHIIDNSRPHRVYFIAATALALNTFMLFLIAGGVVHPPVGSVVSWMFAGIFISGLVRCFVMPASSALYPQIISRAEISAGSAWMSSAFQFASITGPALAGLVYGGYGAMAAWMLPTFLLILTLFMLVGMSQHPRHYKSSLAREPVIISIKKGWRFITGNKIMLPVMMLDMVAVLLGGAVSMLPAYADQVLHVGSEGLGALRAAPALGAIVVALILSLWPMKKIRGSTLMFVVAGFGACIIGFGMSTVFWLSLTFLALSGAFDSVSVVIRTTIMQLLTPDNMRGRVASVSGMFIISSNEIGAFESGFAARLMGLVPSVIFGGVGTLVVVLITAIIAPNLRKAVIEAEK